MLNHDFIGTEHILLGLIHEGEGVAAEVLESLGISLEGVRQQVEAVIARGKETPAGHIPFTPRAKTVLKLSQMEALALRDNYIGTGHILLGLIREGEGVATQVLVNLGADFNRIRLEVLQLRSGPIPALAEFPPGSPLHQFATILTIPGSAPQNRVGRQAEIERVMQVLTRRTRNNPVLIGEPGVGKTAVVEGLVDRIVRMQTPVSLDGHHVHAIDPARLLAGVQDRAQLDARIQALLEALESSKAVLFFDDLHYLSRVTAFGAEIGGVLGPFMGAGYRIIGATTPDRFRQYVGRDPLLERDCQPVDITEPSIADAVKMLKCVRGSLEAHHRISIKEAALLAAVTLARRYRPARVLPGSALDILDDAAALKAVRWASSVPGLRDLDYRIAEVRRDKESAFDSMDFERAAQLRHAEKTLLKQKAQREKEWRDANVNVVSEVDEELVARVLGVEPGAAITPQTVAYRADPGGIQLPVRDRSTALLIGAGSFTDPRLSDMPAISRNLQDLRRTLTADSGLFEPARVHVFDLVEYGDLKSIGTLARATADTLLIYYAGHGLNENDDLYLAFHDTDREEPQLTAFAYAKLRHLVTASPARRCIVVLDCCYAGKVIEWMSTGDSAPIGELDIKGTYILTATGISEKAIAPQGDPHTAFTGALLRLMRDGINNGREFLSVADLHPHLAAELRSRNLPQPRQRPIDSIGSLAIARNASWSSSVADQLDSSAA
jgi:ATP-dependent Clp protease ATP-binding subunit ClpC